MHIKTKLLILDDNADMLNALTGFWEKGSFEVCTVVSEELFKTELNHFKPDVIILDVYNKGDAEGRRIYEMIKNESTTRHIRVILMSANMQLLKNYEECNTDAVIYELFDLLLFLEKIRPLTHWNIGEIITIKKDEGSRLISINQTTDNEKKYATQ